MLVPATALELIVREDRGRQRYNQKAFWQNLDDPELHHLILNVDPVSYYPAAKSICDAALGLVSSTQPGRSAPVR